MKSHHYLGLLLISYLIVSCNTTEQSDDQTIEEEIVFSPMNDIKKTLETKIAKYDSVNVEETDSTYIYYVIPKSEEYDHDKELFGAFNINKTSLALKDINGDGDDDAVIQYTYTPHLDNNTLIYFKVFLQENKQLVEVGEIFGGGRCEGPILSLDRIQNGVIFFNGSDYAQGDPCCCPTIKSTYTYRLENNKIVQLKE